MAAEHEQDTVNETARCCGNKMWPAGESLVLACQLCPNSPTCVPIVREAARNRQAVAR
ncbi:hypothetical protein [Polymorphospora lycopeni]|uniref:Uncharacterized protein n=1 Tax=Polymorphospora lycopeni TaxID=3140240 RepID=A0ABV5CLF3_9ACTN